MKNDSQRRTNGMKQNSKQSTNRRRSKSLIILIGFLILCSVSPATAAPTNRIVEGGEKARVIYFNPGDKITVQDYGMAANLSATRDFQKLDERKTHFSNNMGTWSNRYADINFGKEAYAQQYQSERKARKKLGWALGGTITLWIATMFYLAAK